MNNADALQRSIRKTLVYFDIANFPLTKEELFVFLWTDLVPSSGTSPAAPSVRYEEFLQFLEDNASTIGWECKNGYYFLPGRAEIIEQRQKSLLISERKLKIARRAARLIRSVPYLKAVFVCNTVASEQAGVDSDIDFFIIAAKNRIWIVRLLITFILQIFGLRRQRNKIKDRICLSFYVTEDSLDLANYRAVDEDIHFAFWMSQMLPLYDPNNFYQNLLEANQWIQPYLPNRTVKSLSSYILLVPEGRIGRVWKRAWEAMWRGSYGDLINNQAKQIQMSKISQSQSRSAKFSGSAIERQSGTGVVISDTILKFHEKDTRIDYYNTWKQRLSV